MAGGLSAASTNTTPDSSAWSTVWPYLLTAGLTLLATLSATLFLQFFVIPRVESRKRHDERWERDVLALGDLLSLDQRESAEALGDELYWKVVLAKPRKDADPQRLDDSRREHEERLSAARREYDRVDVRIDWLTDRIDSLGHQTAAIWPFVLAGMKFRVAQMDLSMAYLPVDGEPLTEERLDDVRATERDAVRALLKAVKGLAGKPRPASSVGRRARRRWRRLTAPIWGWLSRRGGKSKTQTVTPG
jgi:hypothetical protein